MRVPVKLLSFSFWLFFLNGALCQECRREDIKYENTELVEKASYADGERVRVNCMTGYTGLYKLKCEKGEWKKTVQRPCTKKKCSHPGDTSNGDFKLIDGTEFVFGVTVVYTCKKGYEMTSRINQRTCRAQGWDNVVPVCEEITCKAPFIRNGYVVEQQPEYPKDAILKYRCDPEFKPRQGIPRCAKFGWTLNPECDEIRCEVPHDQHVFRPYDSFRGDMKLEARRSYSCESGYRETADEATCTRDGWTPKLLCAEITCEVPRDQHVSSLHYYFRGQMKFGARRSYSCESGYRKTEKEATCTRDGWTPNPLCAEITCDLQSKRLGVQKINPNKESFSVKERVEITCSEKYWISGTKESSKSFKCQSNGQWDSEPVCEEVTCHFESITSGVKRIIPEGQTVFKVGESVEIICSEKHLFFTKETIKSFTCRGNGKWNSKPGCEITCEVPRDQHVSGPEYYFSKEMKLGSRRYYDCKSGYRKTAEEATCTRDGWTPNPLCAEMMCDPPSIPNAEILRGQRINYTIGSRIEYKCHSGFEPEESVQITCDSQGQWTGIQQCTDGTCQEQELKNVEILFGYPSTTLPYKPGHILVFRCTDDNMRFYGQHSIKCQPNGRWNYPYPQCGGTVQCSKPTKNLQFVTLSDEKTEYSNYETLTYTCNEPYNETRVGVLKCLNGIWNGTFDCKSKSCPPPLYLQHGDFIINSTKDKVITAVSYMCQSYFVLTKKQDVYKCVDGKWETPPKCLRPCEIDDFVEKYNLQLRTGKVYIRHAEKYRLNCRDGWHTGSEMKSYVDVSCSDGNLKIDKSCDAQSNSK